MNSSDARALLSSAIALPHRRGNWADLGAGDGTFTRALVEILDAESRIYAVDRDREALDALRVAFRDRPNVVPVLADFSRGVQLPAALHGILFANSLHYLQAPGDAVSRIAELLEPDGQLVVIEYDRRGPNQWVPYPIPLDAIEELFTSAGFSPPVITAKQPSRYGGDLYVASSEHK